MKSSEIRERFIEFFVNKYEHTFVPSSSVIGDKTLLFTNSGMVQFKLRFLGQQKLDYQRAANSQKSIRAGGKHNDLDTVGPSPSHHTFFEMLGNWSFGNYFKEEAIAWAWEFLTQELRLDPERLYVTVFGGDDADGLEPDTETEKIWLNYLPADRIIRCDKKDNFWEMAATGPCGPCTEIHFDRTADKSGRDLVNVDGQFDVIELWNLVFIQFNRRDDGQLDPLEEKHVDTGMGLERAAMILQGANSNYQTDLFRPIIAAQEQMFSATYTDDGDILKDIAFRAIADHVRMASISIADGIRPGNKKRDAVLRSVIRRAFRFGWQVFGQKEPFLWRMVDTVVGILGESFPELRRNQALIESLIQKEESEFAETIARGIKRFNETVDIAAESQSKTISGKDAFYLHSTWGFPIDLTRQMAAEHGLTVDEAEYEAEVAVHSATSSKKAVEEFKIPQGFKLPATADESKYTDRQIETAIVGWISGGEFFDSGEIPVSGDEPIAILTSETCLYAECGGQAGDTGLITSLVSEGEFSVLDCKPAGDCIIQIGVVTKGQFKVGDQVAVTVGRDRDYTAAAHTAAHLIHQALHDLLGDGVSQQGSRVGPDSVRFDFACPVDKLTHDQLNTIENEVNKLVDAGLPVRTQVMPLDEANQLEGLRAFFEDSYGSEVRVVEIGDLQVVSRELCGGTHAGSTSAIKLVKIISCGSSSKGIRRIVAVTGDAAVELVREQIQTLQEAQKILDGDFGQFKTRLSGYKKQVKQAKRLARVNRKTADSPAASAANQAEAAKQA